MALGCKALSHLVFAGVLAFRKGVGSFVRGCVLEYDIQSLVSFTRKAIFAGMRPRTRVLEFESLIGRQAEKHVLAARHLDESDRLCYFERLRLADGEPLILERRHVAARCCPGLTRSSVKGSLYALLTGTYGLAIKAADQVIRAVSLLAADARQLQVRTGAAALRVLAVGHADAPVWLEDTLYRADRYEFHDFLGNDTQPRPARLAIAGPPGRGERARRRVP